jgi:hypothetical protein
VTTRPWATTALDLCLQTALVVTVWFVVFLGSARYFDLVPTYVAGQMWLAGNWDGVYQPEIWLHGSAGDPGWRTEIARIGYPGMLNTYVYHPWYLVLTLPLAAALSLHGFTSVFVVLNAIALAWIVRQSLRWGGVEDRRWHYAAVLLLCFSFPVVYGVQLGQNTLIALALVLLAVRIFESGRPWVGGSVMLLAMAAKPWFLLLLGIFPFLGWLKRTFGMVAGYALVMVALPLLALPEALTRDYQAMLARLPVQSILAHNNVSLRAVIHRLGKDDWPNHLLSWVPIPVAPTNRSIELAILVVLGAAAAYLLYRCRGERRVLYSGMVLALLPVGVLWNHYIVMGIPLLIAGLLEAEKKSSVWLLWIAALVAFAVSPTGLALRLAGRQWLGLLQLWIELPLLLLVVFACASLIVPRRAAPQAGEVAE